MTYDLPRLRLHGLVERTPGTHLTDRGLRVALFFTRAYDRLLRPGLSSASSPAVVRNGAHQLTEDER